MKPILASLLATTAAAVAVPAAGQDDLGQPICENAFVPVDPNGDGQLTEAEIRELRDAEFEQLDANDDGSIQREEYRTCIGQAEERARRAAVEAEKSDAFEVGNWSDLEMVQKEEMSGAEFLARAHKAWAEGEVDAAWSTFTFEAAEDHGNELSFARAAVQRFRMHDANNDGVLTQEEWETPARMFEFNDAALDERFDVMDTDNSGAISPQEYRAAGTQAVGLAATEADAAEELPVYYEFYLNIP